MKKGIFEAKSNYQKSLEAKAKSIEDLPASLRGEKKPAKEKDPNQPTQRDWYQLKKERFERQKQQEIQNKKIKAEAEKSKRVSEFKGKAAGALKGIQTQQISKDTPEGTAYKKAIGNVASAVGGVAGAAYYGARALAASRKKIEDPTSKQPEMKEPGKPGRPKTQTEPPKPQERGGALAKREPSGALSKPPSTPSVDKRRMLPTSSQGGTRIGQPARTIGQPAPQRPALPMAVDKRRMLPASSQGSPRVGQPAAGTKPQVPGSQKRKQIQAGTYKPIKSIGEQYSNWREELLIEHGLIVEIDDISTKKGKKKKIVDIMRGKNKVEINPKIGNYFGYNESYETVTEDCGCEDDKKKVLAMAILKKAIDTKKKKNFQLNSEIIGENFQDEEVKTYYKPNKSKVLKASWAVRKQAAEDKKDIKEVAAWQRKEGKNPTGGLNKKGIASYRREHPGSHLSLAVTTKPSKLDPDSKSAKRRKSFCARMGGMPGPMKDEKGRPTRKALSLRKWNC